MLTVISPAKRLDWGPVAANHPASQPEFSADAVALAGLARALSPGDLRRLMSISADLATLNHARFQAFSASPASDAVRPALFGFAGDTYAGLEARTLDPDALRWMQGRLRVLSGLYGLLRPFDAIQPYRLEMGTRLANPRGPDLYAWWGDRIARALDAAAAETGARVLVNCASVEYFGAVDLSALRLRVVTPVFLEDRAGGARVISFFAKRARGAMARFIAEHRLTDPADIVQFDAGGYRHCPALSTPDRPVFLREEQAPG